MIYHIPSNDFFIIVSNDFRPALLVTVNKSLLVVISYTWKSLYRCFNIPVMSGPDVVGLVLLLLLLFVAAPSIYEEIPDSRIW